MQSKILLALALLAVVSNAQLIRLPLTKNYYNVTNNVTTQDDGFLSDVNTLSIDTTDNAFYTAAVNIGNGNQVFNLAIDTATSLIWVATHNLQSNVDNHFGCNDSFTCDTNNYLFPIGRDDDQTVRGSYITENVDLGNGSVVQQGLILFNHNISLLDTPADGVLGLGLQETFADVPVGITPLVDNLQAQAAIPVRQFSIFLTNKTANATNNATNVTNTTQPDQNATNDTNSTVPPVIDNGTNETNTTIPVDNATNETNTTVPVDNTTVPVDNTTLPPVDNATNETNTTEPILQPNATDNATNQTDNATNVTNPNQQSWLILGGFDPTLMTTPDFAYYPLSDNEDWEIAVASIQFNNNLIAVAGTVLFDTRAGSTVVPINIYNTILAYAQAWNPTCVSFNLAGVVTIQCDCNAANLAAPPALTFTFGQDGLLYTINADQLIVPYNTNCLIDIIQGDDETEYVVGHDFMVNYYMLYDIDNRRVGIAPANHTVA